MESENRFLAKIKVDPLMPIGIVGLTAIVVYKLYNFKKRGSVPTSVYLIHMRLAAQGTVVGCLTLGLVYSIYQSQMKKLFPASSNGSKPTN